MLNARFSSVSGLGASHNETVAVSDPRGARLWSKAYDLKSREGVLVEPREVAELTR